MFIFIIACSVIFVKFFPDGVQNLLIKFIKKIKINNPACAGLSKTYKTSFIKSFSCSSSHSLGDSDSARFHRADQCPNQQDTNSSGRLQFYPEYPSTEIQPNTRRTSLITVSNLLTSALRRSISFVSTLGGGTMLI